MNDERPKIKSITVLNFGGETESYGLGSGIGHTFGETPIYCKEIRATVKSGMAADIPYIEVWSNFGLHAEFCQHQIIGVYYIAPGEKIERVVSRPSRHCIFYVNDNER